jgi:hypothetical protein
MKQLKDAVDSTHKVHIGLQNAAAEALQAAERPGNVPGQLILQDRQAKPIQGLKLAIRGWCQKILDREYFFDSVWIEQIIGVTKKEKELMRRTGQPAERHGRRRSHGLYRDRKGHARTRIERKRRPEETYHCRTRQEAAVAISRAN